MDARKSRCVHEWRMGYGHLQLHGPPIIEWKCVRCGQQRRRPFEAHSFLEATRAKIQELELEIALRDSPDD